MKKILALVAFVAIVIINCTIIAFSATSKQSNNQMTWYENTHLPVVINNINKFEKVERLYTKYNPYADNYYKAYKNGKWGLIYKSSAIEWKHIPEEFYQFTEFIYDDIQIMSEMSNGNLFLVSQNNKYGFIKPIWDNVQYKIYYSKVMYDNVTTLLDECYGKILLNGKYAIYNYRLNTLSEFKYDNAEYVFGSTCAIIMNSKKGLFDTYKNKEYTKIIYDDFRAVNVRMGDFESGAKKATIEGKINGMWKKIKDSY